MTRYIPLTILALSLVSGLVQAKDHKEKHKSLPPGLQKKVANGGELPPGWQKKLRRGDILSRDIYDRGRIIQPISDDGIIGIQVDDTIIRVINNTREIVDILSRKH